MSTRRAPSKPPDELRLRLFTHNHLAAKQPGGRDDAKSTTLFASRDDIEEDAVTAQFVVVTEVSRTNPVTEPRL